MDREMSCDWERFQAHPRSSPHMAAGRTVVIALSVCDAIRNPRNPDRPDQIQPAWHQRIFYDPLDADHPSGPNIAHSVVQGSKKLPVRSALADNSRIWDG